MSIGDIAERIAREQIFAWQYSLFEIDRAGITGKMKKDNVAELIAPLHRIIMQPKIDAGYLTWHGDWELQEIAIDELQAHYKKGNLCGPSRRKQILAAK